MGVEIERKFVVPTQYLKEFEGITNKSEIRQAYISSEKGKTVRLRVRDDKGYITVKSSSSDGGLSRSEWEFEIPVSEALEMMTSLQLEVLTKTRYIVPYHGYDWEVDFLQTSVGTLIVAEIEAPTREEALSVPLPPWVGKEVTGNHSFSMSRLIQAEAQVKAYIEAYGG